MKRILRIAVCLLVAFLAVYISGYKNALNVWGDSSVAILSFYGAALVLAALDFIIWELYLKLKTKISQMNARIEQLEQQLKSIEKQN